MARPFPARPHELNPWGQSKRPGTAPRACLSPGGLFAVSLLPGRRAGRAGDSYEALFHEVGLPAFLLRMKDLGEAGAALREQRLERAIGVIYAPHGERHSHYFLAELPAQFDALLHDDTTTAVQPLDRDAGHEEEDAADTWPTGM